MSLTAKQVFEGMPGALNVEKAAGVDVTVQFDLSGDEGGIWSVTVADGECTVVEGPSDSPNLTISMDAGDYAAMVAGELQPMAAFMQGKIRLQGDMGLAMKFQGLFDS